MKKNTLILIFLFLFSLLSGVLCFTKVNKHISKSVEQLNSQYFSDIDLYHLKGLREILPAELHYPYIRIDSASKGEKHVTFYYNDNIVYKSVYKRNGSIWISNHKVENKEEGITSYFYEFISENRIVDLEYSGDPLKDSSLVTLTILEGSRIIDYSFEHGEIKTKPTFNVSDYLLEKSFRISISDFEIKEGVLVFHTQITDWVSNKVIDDKKCYLTNNLSLFWWLVVGYKFEKVNC